MTDGEQLITRRELSNHTGYAYQTLANAETAGTGPKITKVGRRAMYRLADVLAWQQDRRAIDELFNDAEGKGYDGWCSRKTLAEILQAAGYRISPETLRAYGTRKIGPPYIMMPGRRVLYKVSDALIWAAKRRANRNSKKETPLSA